jgi:hypothetical protein
VRLKRKPPPGGCKSYTVDSPLDFAHRLAIDSPLRGDFQ